MSGGGTAGGPTVWDDVARIRGEAPLVHNVTNYVAMNLTANALLAIGASPVMAHALDEVEEMVGLARALVLNIGTLSPGWIEAMLRAGRAARRRGVPIVLDPVGSGATRMRTTTALRLLDEVGPAIVRGNASEIASLAPATAAGGGREGRTKGVDSTRDAEGVLEAAQAVAVRWGCVVATSGPTDVVVDGRRIARVRNGHPLMTRVTAMGCAASALAGAFAAVDPDPFRAAVHAMTVMGVAGELSAERAEGPGTLQLHFLDALHRLGEAELAARSRVEGP